MLRQGQVRVAAGTAETSQLEVAEWTDISDRRPWLGLGLLGGSVIFTASVLIFFGAWFADDRIEARTETVGHEAQGDWWEDGLIAVCPIH